MCIIEGAKPSEQEGKTTQGGHLGIRGGGVVLFGFLWVFRLGFFGLGLL